jgi:hypothetical protein
MGVDVPQHAGPHDAGHDIGRLLQQQPLNPIGDQVLVAADADRFGNNLVCDAGIRERAPQAGQETLAGPGKQP